MLILLLVASLVAAAAYAAVRAGEARRTPPPRAQFDPVRVEDEHYRDIYGERSGLVHLVEREPDAPPRRDAEARHEVLAPW